MVAAVARRLDVEVDTLRGWGVESGSRLGKAHRDDQRRQEEDRPAEARAARGQAGECSLNRTFWTVSMKRAFGFWDVVGPGSRD